ncbi:MAG: DUF1844 domain-containing protein [Candidatus Binatia bacterium]
MTEGAGKGEEKGFKVEDRRRFSDSGEPKEENQTARTQESPVQEAGGHEESGPQQRKQSAPLTEINFSAFVISLSTQALIQLGEVSSPVSGEVERDLALAKQMIDILGMLREKTRGNLDQGEEKLLEDALYDLRIRYVEAVKRS